MRVDAGSLEYVHLPIDSRTPITGLAVELALVPDGTARQNSDFKTAAWDTSSTVTWTDSLGRTWYTTDAVILVGPAQTITLTSGAAYKPYARITSSPEVPILRGIGLVYAD
jgi:hypothetical protein